jgi:hypothetical protein
MRVGREGKMGLFLFFVLFLPAGPVARKEETPSTLKQKQRASYSDFDEILIPAELKTDRKNSFVFGMPRSKVGFPIFEGRSNFPPWRAFFKTIGFCTNQMQVL